MFSISHTGRRHSAWDVNGRSQTNNRTYSTLVPSKCPRTNTPLLEFHNQQSTHVTILNDLWQRTRKLVTVSSIRQLCSPHNYT
jgi:hypothetical protein